MKGLIILLITTICGIIAYDSCEYDNQDGQPGCATDIEINQKLWTNNWDSTKYWECTELGTPAVLRSCPQNKQFYTPSLKCVDIYAWEWTPPCDPPSKPPTNPTNKIVKLSTDITSSCPYDNQDGQPGCKTLIEVILRKWRNNWDPSKYWECDILNEPAVSRECESGKLFYTPKFSCIDIDEWKWTPPCDPISKP